MQPRALLGKNIDWLMVGGLSVLVFCGFHLFVSPKQDSSSLSWLMYSLSFAVNYPHFMVSYQLLYWDQRKQMLRKPAYLWAGFVVPAVLIVTIGLGFVAKSQFILSMLVQLMYITVGWHYVKQTFGSMVVMSSTKNFFFTKGERRALLANLYSLWGWSFLWGQKTERRSTFYGIEYDLVGVAEGVLWTCGVLVCLSLLVVLWLFLKRYIRTGETAVGAAWVSFGALYVWYLPFSSHKHFFLVIPFFHCLQYLLFVYALKGRTWTAELSADSDQPQELRRRWLSRAVIYFGICYVLSVVCFWALPTFFDRQWDSSDSAHSIIWGSSICLAIAHLVINIHHYFIDNVIWRNDNPDFVRAFWRS